MAGGIHRMLLQLTLVAVVLVATVAPATTQAKPGCPGRCGNLNIPYPFGTKDDCYLNEDVLISCDYSLNPPKAFLNNGNINVTDISLQGQLHILQFIAHDCYSQNGTQEQHNSPWLRLSKIFTISDDENKFVAVGCDTYATISGYRGSEQYTTGCISTCNNIYDISESCSGAGCCQISIAKGLWNISLALESYYNHLNVWDFNPCSYALVVEEKTFNFSKNDLRNSQNIEDLSLVLDWAIGDETCEIVGNNETSYACKGNSVCYDNDNGFGYRCQCLEGDEGNPYLDGCQGIHFIVVGFIALDCITYSYYKVLLWWASLEFDCFSNIDECKNSSLNQCEKQEYCGNTVGNYTCSCPKGYSGDGRKDKKGCTKNPIAIQVGLG